VEVLTDDQVSQLPPDADLINIMAQAMKKRTGETDAQIQKEHP